MTSPAISPRRARSPRGQAGSLRDEITRAALVLIDTDGAQALTLRGLARSVGVSAPAIYAHFANTDAVLLAVAERLFTDLALQLREVFEQREAGDPAQRLRALCASYLDYAERHPNRYLVLFGGRWDARVAVERGAVDVEPVLALGQDVLVVITSAVDACVPGTGSTPDAGAVAVWVLLHGYAHQRIVSSAFPWPPDMTDQVIDGALRMSR